MTKIISAAVMYAPTASLSESSGNSTTSSAVPGADQAVTIGALSHIDRKIPETAAPMEMAQTQEVIISGDTFAAAPAWKKIAKGPA